MSPQGLLDRYEMYRLLVAKRLVEPDIYTQVEREIIANYACRGVQEIFYPTGLLIYPLPIPLPTQLGGLVWLGIVLEWCWSGLDGVGVAWNGVGMVLEWCWSGLVLASSGTDGASLLD